MVETGEVFSDAPTGSPLEVADVNAIGGDKQESEGLLSSSFLSEGGMVLLIIIGLITVLLLCIFCGLIMFCVYKKRKSDQLSTDRHHEMVQLEMNSPKSPSEGNLEGDGRGTYSSPASAAMMSMATNVQMNSISEIPELPEDHNELKAWLMGMGLTEYFDLFMDQGFGDQMGTLSTLINQD